MEVAQACHLIIITLAQIRPDANLISEPLYFGRYDAIIGKPNIFYFNEYTFVLYNP